MKRVSFAVALGVAIGLTACQTTTDSGPVDHNALSTTGQNSGISRVEFNFQLFKIAFCDYRYGDAYPYLKKRRPADELSAFARFYKANKSLCNEAEQVQSVGEKIAWLEKQRQFGNRWVEEARVPYARRGVEEDVTLWQYLQCEQQVRGREVAALNFVIKHAPSFEERLKNQYQRMVRARARLCPATARSIDLYGGRYGQLRRTWRRILYYGDIPRSL